MTGKTHWKRLINPNYIGAYSLEKGQDLSVVIESVCSDVVTGTGGKKEESTIAYLKGQKPFILNNTNSKSIAKLYGPYIEDWSGKPITLFASTTKLAGDTVECLRIARWWPNGRNRASLMSASLPQSQKSKRASTRSISCEPNSPSPAINRSG